MVRLSRRRESWRKTEAVQFIVRLLSALSSRPTSNSPSTLEAFAH
jgi:hypothetical protein